MGIKDFKTIFFQKFLQKVVKKRTQKTQIVVDKNLRKFFWQQEYCFHQYLKLIVL